MIVHIRKITDTEIFGTSRMESEDGTTIGDAPFEMVPGESFNGVTFEQIKAKGLGKIELPDAPKKNSETT